MGIRRYLLVPLTAWYTTDMQKFSDKISCYNAAHVLKVIPMGELLGTIAIKPDETTGDGK